VGTQSGLNRLDPRASRIERIAGLGDAYVLALAADREGRLWGGGLALVDRR
jgi:hypothetical protein